MAATTPVTPLTRKATIQTLQRFPTLRRSSFLMELRDQLQNQYEGEMERERLKDVLGIHRILEKPPEARDSQDIDTLYEFVLQNGSTNKIFQGAQEIICKTICREMTLLELPARGVVCYQGDYGDTFFIIIQGSVSLFIDSKRKLIMQSEENGIQDKNDRYLHTSMAATPSSSSHTLERMDSEGNPLPENYGSFIKQIGSGGTFGELAVMDPTARRSCTITCDTPTSFICLKRGAYQRLIRITNSSQLDFTQVEYLETLFFFDQWPHGELTRLSNRLRHLNFPADTFLARVGSEANVVFFIYSGVVQESIPLVHYLNSNGTVFKCTRLENDSSKRSLQESGGGNGGISSGSEKDAKHQHQQQTKRIALELNVYQDHDVCGEYPVLFNRTVCNTDLLAVTDVKTLIMDVSVLLVSEYSKVQSNFDNVVSLLEWLKQQRETWKELFFMHGLEHIRDSYRKLRSLAESRENWRQTRTKLALSNPGLILTISTKAMMHDGKCICGWCGSKEHITGDLSCAVMLASKKKQADKQKNGKNKARKALEMGIKAQAVKNTLTFMHSVTEAAQHSQQEPTTSGDSIAATQIGQGAACSPSGAPPSQNSRRVSLQIAAKQIISDHAAAKNRTSNQESPSSSSPQGQVSQDSSATTGGDGPGKRVTTPSPPRSQTPKSPVGSSHNLFIHPAAAATLPRKVAISDFKGLSSASNKLYAYEMQQLLDNPDGSGGGCLPVLKVEEVRKSVFPEQVESQYRQILVRKVKCLTTAQDYFDARSQVLESMKEIDAKPSDDRYQAYEQVHPRKPKIPKPSRHLCSKNKQQEPRPDRFNRKINRMLKRLRLKEHSLPVMEESLKDF